MIEKIITLEQSDLIEVFGVNNINLKTIKSHFPKVKIIARGNELRVLGESDETDRFQKKIEQILHHYNKFNKLTSDSLDNILLSAQTAQEDHATDDVITYGNNGKAIRPITPNQKVMVQEYMKNDMIFAIGPAGTGKTYLAIALAVRALKNKEVKRIILSRPAVEAEEHLGFLPGDLKDKLDPYLQPLYDALYDMIPPKKLSDMMADRVIEIAPLAFMRGRTLNNAFVILDEAQNATVNQLKMFLTRMGPNAKFVITGDITQIDLPKKTQSGLITSSKILKNIDGIGFTYFESTDIVRHRLVKHIVEAYDNLNP